MKLQLKTLDTESQMSFPGWQSSMSIFTFRCWEANTFLRMIGSFTFETLPAFSLYISSFGWFKFVAFWYNKIVIINIALLLRSVSLFRKLSNLRQIMGTPEFVPNWLEVRVAPQTPKLAVVSEMRAVLWGLCSQNLQFDKLIRENL